VQNNQNRKARNIGKEEVFWKNMKELSKQSWNIENIF